VEILSSKPEIDSPGTKTILTPNRVDVHDANLPHRHIAFIYYARSASDKFVLSDEHTDFKWFTVEDLNDPKYALSPAIIFYCQEALRHAAE
jgi:hypothetical protein